MKKSTLFTITRFFTTTIANTLNIFFILSVIKETNRLKEIAKKKNNFYNKSNYISQVILAALILPYQSFKAFKYTYDSVEEAKKMRKEEKQSNKKIVRVPIVRTDDFEYYTMEESDYDPELDNIQLQK